VDTKVPNPVDADRNTDRRRLSSNDRDPGTFEVLVALSSFWRTIAIVTGAALALAVVYLHLTTHKYTAELKVAPTLSSANSITSRLGGLGALASLAGLNEFLGDDSQPFQLYLEGLHSQEAADALAKNQLIMRTIFRKEWDSDRGTWRAPPFAQLKRFVKRSFGLPASQWSPPDAARLREYLRKHVEITQSLKTSVVTVTLDYSDPDFAVTFLTALDKAVDETLRESKLERSKAFIAYLTAQLEKVTVVEHRQALSVLLGEEERSRMLASSGAPIAAETFGRPAASLYPTKPRVILVLVGSILGGIMLGCLVVILRDLWLRRDA
jgi:uncharacterized protein involved in exopolysaccharide biosynthesis